VSDRLAADLQDVTVSIALKRDDPIDRLRALKAADEEVERWLVEAVADARRAGRSWAAIGDALGVSRQAAWQLYNTELRTAITQVRKRAGLTEKEALALAQKELGNVRSRRRR
jgi:hypothetical protein